MDEYCIVPKRVLNTKQEVPAMHPAEAGQVKSLSGLLASICEREDISQDKKADMLRATIERFLALTSNHHESNFALSVPKETKVSVPLSTSAPEVIPQVTSVASAPLVSRRKRKTDLEDEVAKRINQGPEVEFPALRVPVVTSVPSAPLVGRTKRKADAPSRNKRVNNEPDRRIAPLRFPTVTSVATAPLVRRSKRKAEADGWTKRQNRQEEVPEEAFDDQGVDSQFDTIESIPELKGRTRKPLKPLVDATKKGKRTDQEFRKPPAKRAKEQSGGLKSRWIVLR